MFFYFMSVFGNKYPLKAKIPPNGLWNDNPVYKDMAQPYENPPIKTLLESFNSSISSFRNY